MSFNGSGTFSLIYDWLNDKAANIKVRSDRMMTQQTDIATGLSTCITKDGQTTITANLPMANFRHTGVGNASARTDYASAGQVQDGKLNWVAAGGTADAITATYSPAITALVDGQICYVRAGAANATTTPTFSPNTLTPRTITKNGNQALVAGDIFGASHELVLRYRLSDTKWELMNPVYPFAFTPFALTLLDDANAPEARTTLGAAASGANSDITSLSAVTGLVKSVAIQKITSTGTYTPTANMLYCVAECWGGGGAGAGCEAVSGATGGGGGAGGYARKLLTAAQIGASKAVTIGAGGTGSSGAAGGNGGATSVDTLCVAGGGSGGSTSGAAANPSAGGNGGVGTTGDVLAYGGYGHNGIGTTGTSTIPQGGNGGVSSRGGNGKATIVNGATDGNAAQANTGSGGSGASTKSTAQAGGDGGSGYVIITEFIG